jgi:hypothetical protein
VIVTCVLIFYEIAFSAVNGGIVQIYQWKFFVPFMDICNEFALQNAAKPSLVHQF